MARTSLDEGTRTVASAYLSLLADRGVDCLFGNAGTDFAPLVEAYAERTARTCRARFSPRTRIWRSAWLTATPCCRAGCRR